MLRSRDPDHFAQELLCGNLEENLHLVALVVLHPIDQRGNDQTAADIIADLSRIKPIKDVSIKEAGIDDIIRITYGAEC